MAGDDLRTPANATWIPAAIVALGVLLLLGKVGSQIVINGPAVLLEPEAIIGIGIVALFAVPVIYGGYWLHRSEIGADRYPRVASWCLAVLAGLLAVNLVMMAVWPADTLAENVGWAFIASAMGAIGGLTFGSIEARAIERALNAERVEVRAEQLEAQRQWLEYLNSLLRHEVLNTANVLVGYADLLIEDHDGDDLSREYLERIARQSRKMTDVIQDVRLLIRATNGDADLRDVDVVSVLDDEVKALEDRHGNVSVSTSFPDSAVVAADDLLARVFSNVLQNAVLHNDAEAPRVEVEVRTDPETATITVADNGPGVPEDVRDSLFDQDGQGDHGLGLFLVRTLLDRYDGSIELAETGPEGSVFAIELPRVSAEPTTADGRAATTPNAV